MDWTEFDDDDHSTLCGYLVTRHGRRDEAVRELYSILSRMNEERREVLVLSELEEISAREIAQALQVNVNTVSWRLRTARREFERMVLRRSAAERSGAR